MIPMPRVIKTARTGPSRSAPSPGAHTTGSITGARAVKAAGTPAGRFAIVGEEVYLWILVLVEVALIAWLRASFSRYHGG